MQTLDCPVIDALPDRERKRLLDRAVLRSLAPNEPLFMAGERAGHVYVVADGVVKLAARDPNGNETILALAGWGELLGDLAALEGTHPSDGIAASRCRVAAIEAGLFLEIVTAHPAAALELARSLAERWRRISTVALERTTGEVPVRLAGRLLEIAEICGRIQGGTIEMEMPLAQEDLGRLAGMCRESTCKTLSRFKRAGVVDYRGRRFRILRPEVLRQITCAARGAEPSR